MDAARWVVVREHRRGGRWNEFKVSLPPGEPLVVGREAAIALGVHPEDKGVSRIALTVSADRHGWRISVGNRSGARIHPWGLAAVPAHSHQSSAWPLVGVRVLCSDTDHQHWVLLESTIDSNAELPVLAGTGLTTSATRPKPLTAAETDVLQLVFADHLAWPPRLSAAPLQLKQAARKLGITDSAVQLRLNGALGKARRLGFDRPVRLTEPDYVHALVATGYLRPSAPNHTRVSA